jgi:hypothetical protein
MPVSELRKREGDAANARLVLGHFQESRNFFARGAQFLQLFWAERALGRFEAQSALLCPQLDALAAHVG